MNNTLKVPMVIRHREIDDIMVYTGFVPGFAEDDVISIDFEQCKKLLKERTRQNLERYIDEKLKFPFFPTEKEIREDFKDVVYIKFLEI